jgi:hypothetical protein
MVERILNLSNPDNLIYRPDDSKASDNPVFVVVPTQPGDGITTPKDGIYKEPLISTYKDLNGEVSAYSISIGNRFILLRTNQIPK